MLLKEHVLMNTFPDVLALISEMHALFMCCRNLPQYQWLNFHVQYDVGNWAGN